MKIEKFNWLLAGGFFYQSPLDSTWESTGSKPFFNIGGGGRALFKAFQKLTEIQLWMAMNHCFVNCDQRASSIVNTRSSLLWCFHDGVLYDWTTKWVYRCEITLNCIANTEKAHQPNGFLLSMTNERNHDENTVHYEAPPKTAKFKSKSWKSCHYYWRFYYRPHSGGTWKVMFSQVSVCLSVHRGVPLVTGRWSLVPSTFWGVPLGLWSFRGVTPWSLVLSGGVPHSSVTGPVQSPVPGPSMG